MLGPEHMQASKMKDNSTRLKDKGRKWQAHLRLTKSSSHEDISSDQKRSAETKPSCQQPCISMEAALVWSDSFEELLKHPDGVKTFSQFLKTQFSEENIEFWLACEDYKTTDTETKLLSKAKQMYALFIDAEAPKEINIDYSTKAAIQKNIVQPTRDCFDAAQDKVYSLMKKDCYPRFLSSDIYLQLTKKRAPGAAMCRRRSRSFVFNDHVETPTDSAWL